MTIFEKRTYTIAIGRIAEFTRIYEEIWKSQEADELGRHLRGAFISETGVPNQVIQLFAFEDDSARRAFWRSIWASPESATLSDRLAPLIREQDVQLLSAAPWGPDSSAS